MRNKMKKKTILEVIILLIGFVGREYQGNKKIGWKKET